MIGFSPAARAAFDGPLNVFKKRLTRRNKKESEVAA
jgi:hypothetical protein